MKKVFLFIIIICFIFMLFNTIPTGIDASTIAEQEFIEKVKKQTDEFRKLDEFLEKGKTYDNFLNEFGGAYFENGNITINVKNEFSDILLKTIDYNDTVNIKGVKYSQNELSSEMKFFEQFMGELSIESISRSDSKNTLIITINNNFVQNEQIIRKLTKLDNIIILDQQLHMQTLAKYVINGKELILNSSTPFACTAGFAARNSDGDPGVVTAGHCVTGSLSYLGTKVYYNSSYVGNVGSSSTYKFSGSTDAAFIKLRDPLIGTTWLPTKEFMNGDFYNSASAVSSYIVEGTEVFMYGKESGMVSGVITSVNATVQVGTVTLYNTVITDIVGIKGDSGAALTYWVYVSGGTAKHTVLGVLSSGNSSSTVYTTVNYIFSDLNIYNY